MGQRVLHAVLFKDIASRIYDDPDLFCPIWIDMTLVFMLCVVGNIAFYIDPSRTEEFHFNYRLVHQAFTVIFGLGMLVPSLIFLFFFLFGFAPSWKSFIGVISIYNYSNIFFILGALAHLIPLKAASFVVLGVVAALSVIFLLINYSRFTEKYQNNRKKFILIFIAVFQGLALLSYKFVFFN